MNLKEIARRLEELIPLVQKASREYAEKSYAKEKRTSELYLQNEFFRNKEMRDSAVRKILELENLVRPPLDAQLKIRQLYNEKDLLMEISRILRSQNEV